jgi:hypothetical protein
MKKMNVTSWSCISVAVFIALLCSTISASNANDIVGVSKGDWIKYGEFSASWNGTGTEPSYCARMRDSDWFKIEIAGISGDAVTMLLSGVFKNGTNMPGLPATTTIDLATGQGNTPFVGYGNEHVGMLIPANSNEGDVVHQQCGGVFSTFAINGTTQGTYCGENRTLNFLDIATTNSKSSSTIKIHWDKTTGILVEVNMTVTTITPVAQRVESTMKATETNMWESNLTEPTGSENRSTGVFGLILRNLIYIVVIVVLIAIAIIGALFAVRRRSKPTLTSTHDSSNAPCPYKNTCEGQIRRALAL